MKTFVSTTPKVDSEDEDEDGDGYLSFEHGRRKHGTFKATCTRFLSLIFTLVFLGICAAALLFYQVLPSLLPTSRTIRKLPTKLSFFFFRGVCMCVCVLLTFLSFSCILGATGGTLPRCGFNYYVI